jgi:ligand-binding SRPBCC domain-containing protein
MHRIIRSQVFHTDLQRVWDFLCAPKNLNQITPDDLDFEIVSDVPDEMYDGLLLEYRLRIPCLGRQKWVSEIKDVRPPYSFVDEQKVGPYRFWSHYHELSEVEDGIRMVDKVTYEIPYGVIGEFAYCFFVKRTLDRIFDYRERKLEELLNHKE